MSKMQLIICFSDFKFMPYETTSYFYRNKILITTICKRFMKIRHSDFSVQWKCKGLKFSGLQLSSDFFVFHNENRFLFKMLDILSKLFDVISELIRNQRRWKKIIAAPLVSIDIQIKLPPAFTWIFTATTK